MSARLITVLMKQTRRLTRSYPPESDAALVDRFASRRDEAAFADLVRRHGPMVWAVCRNALSSEADAEDAFQATFLALVRHARTLKRTASVGAWLHGSAVRVCLMERRSARRRRVREGRASRGEGVAFPAGEAWSEDLARAHEAIRRLPRREHEAFVLCVLQGVPQAEAAGRLGLKLNTISGLLARARRRLQSQLKSTGTLSLAAVAVAASCPAAVPFGLLAKALRLADPAVILPRSVVLLTSSLSEVAMRKVLLSAVVVMTLGAGVTVGRFLVGSADAQSPGPAPTLGVPLQEPPADPQETHRRYQERMRQLGYMPSGGSGSVSAGSAWEYKTLLRNADSLTETTLNELGAAGWDLCSMTAVPNSTRIMVVFKRPRQGGDARLMKPRGEEASSSETGERTQRAPIEPSRGAPTKGFEASQGAPTKGVNPFAEGRAKREEVLPIYFERKLKDVNVADVATTLRRLFPDSAVVGDPRTNTLHVQGTRADVLGIERVLKQLDQGDTKGVESNTIKR